MNLSWNENYWDRYRILPKVIFGTTGFYLGIIPRLNFDWNPAQIPYEGTI